MIHLEQALKTSLQDVLKTFLQDVLKTFWRRLEDVLKTFLQDVLKTYDQDEYIGLDQDVFWRSMSKVNILVLIKTSSEEVWVSEYNGLDQDVLWRRLLKTKTKDVFIKTNVCWVVTEKFQRHLKVTLVIRTKNTWNISWSTFSKNWEKQ